VKSEKKKVKIVSLVGQSDAKSMGLGLVDSVFF
jgi:hypothetical protein